MQNLINKLETIDDILYKKLETQTRFYIKTKNYKQHFIIIRNCRHFI